MKFGKLYTLTMYLSNNLFVNTSQPPNNVPRNVGGAPVVWLITRCEAWFCIRYMTYKTLLCEKIANKLVLNDNKMTQNWDWTCSLNHVWNLNYFTLMFHFYSPWKCQKTRGFFISIKRGLHTKMFHPTLHCLKCYDGLKMELSRKIVNNFQPLTNFRKSSILEAFLTLLRH